MLEKIVSTMHYIGCRTIIISMPSYTGISPDGLDYIFKNKMTYFESVPYDVNQDTEITIGL